MPHNVMAFFQNILFISGLEGVIVVDDIGNPLSLIHISLPMGRSRQGLFATTSSKAAIYAGKRTAVFG